MYDQYSDKSIRRIHWHTKMEARSQSETRSNIDDAVNRVASLLRDAKADITTVQEINHKIQQLVLPPRSATETEAHNAVSVALASQRAVALLRTEAKLHTLSAERGRSVIKRLEKAQLATNEGFRRSVIMPAAAEAARMDDLAQLAARNAVQKEEEFVVLRREANCAVSLLMAQTERKYDESFQEALSHEDGSEAAHAVYDICHFCKNAEGGHCRQPLQDGMGPTSPAYLDWLRNQAQDMLSSHPPSDFITLANHIAESFGGAASIAPIKGFQRTVQKAQEKYGGNYSFLLDLARGMVIFDDIVSLAAALEYIENAHNKNELRIVRTKDRLSPRFDASRFTGGYRDVLLNLAFSNGHIVELQLHIKQFLSIKNSRGHVDYEAARSIHMFNEAFSHRSFRWLPAPDCDEEKVGAVLRDISEGAIASINMDYSEGLWSDENQSRLAEACLDARCRIRDLSLRSCRCGDDFIVKCLPLDDEELWSPKNRPVCNTVRLGSKLHEGTAGRISSKGIYLVLKFLNDCLRVLDLEGCLNLDWCEDCGDEVAETIQSHIRRYEDEGATPLPQLEELNLTSTGLTSKGMSILEQLKKDGYLRHTRIIRDDELRTKAPRRMEHGASSRMLWA